MFQKLLIIALAGSVGTLARYGIVGLVQGRTGGDFPWGTFAANMAGCFLAGLVWALAETRVSLEGPARTYIMVGFMGAFTTFSAYTLETSELLRAGQYAFAAANVALQNTIGIALFFTGLSIGKYV